MVLALDASISSTGYSVIKEDSRELMEFGKIVTNNKKNTEDERIMIITLKIVELIKLYGVNKVIMESQFAGKNIKTSMQLSRLRGAIMFACKTNGCEIEYMTPGEIRKELMNNGSAKKEEVADFVREMFSEDKRVQALGEFNDRQCKAKNSDIYDAISIGVAFINKRVKWVECNE